MVSIIVALYQPLFPFLSTVILCLGTLAMNPDHSVTQTIKYNYHVCLHCKCVCLREEKEGRLIKDNSNHLQPLKGEKTILGRSKRPFLIRNETFAALKDNGDFKAL